MLLGSDDFVDRLRQKIEADKDLSEIPRSQRRGKPKSLEYYARICQTRDDAILASYASGGYSLKQIGDYHGLHYSRISRIVNRDIIKAKGKTA